MNKTRIVRIIRDDGQEYTHPEKAAQGLLKRPESTFVLDDGVQRDRDVTEDVRRVASRLYNQEQKRRDLGATGLYE